MTHEDLIREVRQGAAAPLIRVQDYIDLMKTAFEDLFEMAVAPEAVVARLRAEVEARKPAATKVIGPEIVDHDLRLSIRQSNGGFVTVIVRPEGDYAVLGMAQE